MTSAMVKRVAGGVLLAAAALGVYTMVPNKSASSMARILRTRSFGSNGEESQLWVAVLSSHVSGMSEETLDAIVSYQCQQGAHVHMVVKSAMDSLLLSQRRQAHAPQKDHNCGEFHVLVEPDHLASKLPNRIDRIAHLRDLQRHEIQTLTQGKSVDAVIVLDGDLFSVPNPALVVYEMEKRITNGSWDVLCAAGVNHDGTTYGEDGFGYYDTFATIFKPNTWLYPREFRLDSTPQPEEDETMIVKSSSKNMVGKTSRQVLEHIQSHSEASGIFQVESCFGGMAIYKGSVWLNQAACQYDSQGLEGGYANRDEKRTCEHVTFHQCLHEAHSDLKVGIHSHLITEYHDVRSVVEFHRFLQDTNGTEYVRRRSMEYGNCKCMFELTLLTDQDGQDTDWRLKFEDNDTIVANGTMLESNMLYEESVCLEEEGEYTFTIYDEAGNGIEDPGFFNYTACNGTYVYVGGGTDEPFGFDQSSFEVN